MSSTKAYLKINWLGQLTGLPDEMLAEAGLKAYDVVEASVEEGQLKLAKADPKTKPTAVTDIPSWVIKLVRKPSSQS